MTYHGGCQCGAVAFEADGEIQQLVACNCSICKPNGYLLWFVPEADFRLTTDENALTEYRFNSHKIGHQFCSTCGVSTFGHGPGTYAVNARTLKDFDVTSVPVQAFDGASK